MKRKMALLLVVAMTMSIFTSGCGQKENGSSNSGKKDKIVFSVEVEGESVSPEEFFGANDLKREEYVGKRVKFVGSLKEVTGAIRYSNIAEMDSSIKVQLTDDAFQYVAVDTSGLEDTVKDWSVGDIICLEVNISYFTDGTVYVTKTNQADEGAIITNQTKDISVVNFEKEVLNDIDAATYQAIDSILLSNEDEYWELTDDNGVQQIYIFNQGTFKVTMVIAGQSISNTGTYVIKDKAILVTYDNGNQAIMRYTFENNDITYLGALEAY